MLFLSVVAQGGREEQLILCSLERGPLSTPLLIRLKALYLASFMSDVVKLYSEQMKNVTAGMSTSSIDRGWSALMCCTFFHLLKGLHFPFPGEKGGEIATGQCL